MTRPRGRQLPYVALMALLFAAHPACGHHKASGQAAGDDGSAAVDGSVGSTNPHPATCTTCPQANWTASPGCDTVVGAPQACEGFCFVQPQVVPTYLSAPDEPASGPAFSSYEYWNPPAGNIHTDDILARGTFVHNLAHGFVVVAYNCPAGCDSEVSRLIAHNNAGAWAGRKVMLTRDPDLDVALGRFAAIGWTYVYRFDSVDSTQLDNLDCFVSQHEGHGLVSHAPKVIQ